MLEKQLTITNKTGLHARPASIFVAEAMKFEAKINVATKAKTVDAKSLISILSLGASKGTEIIIQAEGVDEEAAVDKLVELLTSEFGVA